MPVPKAETRWEKFAKIKGIQKKKKSKWDWDEAYVAVAALNQWMRITLHTHTHYSKQEWRPRVGFQRANNEMDDWVIEDNSGKSLADPNYDPFVEKEVAKVCILTTYETFLTVKFAERAHTQKQRETRSQHRSRQCVQKILCQRSNGATNWLVFLLSLRHSVLTAHIRRHDQFRCAGRKAV